MSFVVCGSAVSGTCSTPHTTCSRSRGVSIAAENIGTVLSPDHPRDGDAVLDAVDDADRADRGHAAADDHVEGDTVIGVVVEHAAVVGRGVRVHARLDADPAQVRAQAVHVERPLRRSCRRRSATGRSRMPASARSGRGTSATPPSGRSWTSARPSRRASAPPRPWRAGRSSSASPSTACRRSPSAGPCRPARASRCSGASRGRPSSGRRAPPA